MYGENNFELGLKTHDLIFDILPFVRFYVIDYNHRDVMTRKREVIVLRRLS